MFSGCTGLTTAPDLPATTLRGGCYKNMFYECTNLTIAPVLPAAYLPPNSYESMFVNCRSLNSVICLATDYEEYSAIGYMLTGAGTNGILKRAPGVSWWTNYLPSTWTVEDYVAP